MVFLIATNYLLSTIQNFESMHKPNEYGQKCLDKLHKQIINGSIDRATQVQIIELLSSHLMLSTTTTFAEMSRVSYRAARNKPPDIVIDGIHFYIFA